MSEPNSWTLEDATSGFDEVVRRALAHRPQLVRGIGADESVVVVARSDYERLLAPVNLVDFLQTSPLAEAVANGEMSGGTDRFERQRDAGRDAGR